MLPAGGLDPPDGQARPVVGDHRVVAFAGLGDGPDLDGQVEDFRTRPLDASPNTFLAGATSQDPKILAIPATAWINQPADYAGIEFAARHPPALFPVTNSDLPRIDAAPSG